MFCPHPSPVVISIISVIWRCRKYLCFPLVSYIYIYYNSIEHDTIYLVPQDTQGLLVGELNQTGLKSGLICPATQPLYSKEGLIFCQGFPSLQSHTYSLSFFFPHLTIQRFFLSLGLKKLFAPYYLIHMDSYWVTHVVIKVLNRLQHRSDLFFIEWTTTIDGNTTLPASTWGYSLHFFLKFSFG